MNGSSPNEPGDPYEAEFRRASISALAGNAKGWREIERLYEAGSPRSSLLIADALRIGRPYAQDLQYARRIYERAAKVGFVRGTHGMGLVDRKLDQYKKAIDEFSYCIERNYAPSMNILALMYMYGEGVSRDISASYDLWVRASKLGHSRSGKNLGLFLIRGFYGPARMPIGAAFWISGLISELSGIVFKNNVDDFIE